jgi:hypothetical protein
MKLGDKVRDKYTGFTGWCHGIATYITGCNQVLINPRTLKKEDGKPTDGEWFDDIRVELVEDLPEAAKRQTGGPSSREAANLRNC